MAVVLARVDDRLVHGQVVLGCCEALRADRILVCDEAVAADPFEREIYDLAITPPLRAEYLGVEECVRRLRALEADDPDERVLVLTRDLSTMRALVDAGAPLPAVTLGGAHRREGAQERWPGFYLDDREFAVLESLRARGVRVRVQTVPGAPAIELESPSGGSGGRT